MNSTDRSIAFLDMALRRRFAFLEILPRPEELGDIEVGGVNLQHLLSTLNRVIEEERGGKDYTIGHGYFREVIKLSRRRGQRHSRTSSTTRYSLFSRNTSTATGRQ
ncbi:hypothetical protein [Thermococcus sp. JCM 11816]|uniref:hypothetical protein n=1 Tax=Thermococcus sp. (strain JCM 11816 / KS-1) TaxID=1295125 RepID=UPI0006D1F068